MNGSPCSHGNICSVGETITVEINNISCYRHRIRPPRLGVGGSSGKAAEEVTVSPNADKSRRDLDRKGEWAFQVQEKVCSKTWRYERAGVLPEKLLVPVSWGPCVRVGARGERHAGGGGEV